MTIHVVYFLGLITVAIASAYFLFVKSKRDSGQNAPPAPSVLPALQILYDGPSEGEPEVDIIAVHGLGSNVDWAWTHKEGHKHVHWLRDSDMLPARVPSARIMVYSYDSKWHADAPVLRLQECGRGLFDAIHEDRERHPKSAQRAMLFVGHSLGGNVIINGLVSSYGDERRRYLFDLTVGVVLLGCPLMGSKMTPISRFIAKVMSSRGSHSGIIEQLGYGDRRLRETLISFQKVSRAHSMSYYCFYEVRRTDYGRKFGLPGFVQGLVVDEDSACIDDERKPINTDHLQLNKYSGPDDQSYRYVSLEIARMCNEVGTVLEKRKKVPKAHQLIPFGRNENFVGRVSIMTELMKRLPPDANDDQCQRTALSGLGGVGKSAMALEAAYLTRERDPYCSIFWISALGGASFENGYLNIGRMLKIPGLENPKASIKKLVKEALSKEEIGNWLLIVDNVDDIAIFGKRSSDTQTSVALESHLPTSRKGSILFTTRNLKATHSLADKIIRVPSMQNEEARELMHRNLWEESIMTDTASVDALLGLLVNLPLAIKQAASFINQNSLQIKEYVELFNSSNNEVVMELLSEEYRDEWQHDKVRRVVATTWFISFQQISETDSSAAELLKKLCFLAETDIPESFVFLPQDDDGNKLRLTRAIGTLKGYGFIHQKDDAYNWHRLVRLCTLNWLRSNDELKNWGAKVVDRLNTLILEPNHENKGTWIRYLPHTRFILDPDTHVGTADSKRCLLCSTAACYFHLGNYPVSERLFRAALDLALGSLGTQHVDTLTLRNRLANAVRYQGRYLEGEFMHRETLQIQEKLLGREDPQTLQSISDLANLLSDQGKYKEAAVLYQEVLELRQKVLGSEHPDTLWSMNNFGSMLRFQGKYAEAERIYPKTLELRKRVLGKEHPHTLLSMNNLASLFRELGKYSEAERIFQEIIQLRKKLLGNEHPDTLDSMRHLAIVFYNLGRLEEAASLHQKTLRLRRKVQGNEHPETLLIMSNLTVVLRDLGRHAEAERMNREILELRAKVLGDEHPDVVWSMHHLATVLGLQGKFVEAEKMFERTLLLRKKVFGNEHPDTLVTMQGIAKLFHSQSRYVEAEQMYRETLRLHEKVLADNHPDTLGCMNDFALVLEDEESYKEAEHILRLALAGRVQVLGLEHPNTAKTKEHLKRLRAKQSALM